MIEEIKEELMIYFKSGVINPKTFFKLEGVNYKSMHDILKIHFILSNEVQDYVLGLEQSIKNIKNSTGINKKLFNGEIRGNIDWNKTIEYRCNTFPKDGTKFVCENVNKIYDIKENLVLKKTISIIYSIIHLELGMDRFNARPWYEDGEKISSIISNIYNKNIYIKRIDISNILVTNKMISDVFNSRNKLYKDSANILKLYNDIMNLDEEEITKMFSSTFIDIQDENTVFELYSIFKYIRNEFPSDKLKYNILDGKEDCLAKLEDSKYIYEFYHDSIGRSNINFNIYRQDIENSENLYLERKLKVLNKKASIYKELEGRDSSNNVWSGRPDFLIMKINKISGNIVKLTLGEIKYTNDKNYMYTGLEELLEYMNFVRDEELSYMGDLLIEGLLFVDDIALNKNEFENIKIINRDLRTKENIIK